MSHDNQYMIERIKKELVGRRIMGPALSDDNQSFGFVLDNDLVVWIDRDAEGNGPGWLSME